MGVLEVAEFIGIVAFALSGFWVAVKERLDILGCFIASFLSALGGGVIRDVTVLKLPFAFENTYPTAIVIAVIFFAFLARLHERSYLEDGKIFLISDTVGLASFSITGALVGIEAGLGIVGTALLALVTAVGGGVLRDILLNRVPFMLKEDFYGTVSILAGISVFLIYDSEREWVLIPIFVFAVFLRLWAAHKGWRLPRI